MNVLTEKTMVPISLILTMAGVISGCLIWIGGLAMKVENQAVAAIRLSEEIRAVKSEQMSNNAEIISQLRSLAMTVQDVQIDSATTKANVTTILRILEREHKK